MSQEAEAFAGAIFRIADADMTLRGPGDFLGTRQHGLPAFRVANLLRDTELMRAARDDVADWLADDPDLTRPGSQAIRAVLEQRWRGRLERAWRKQAPKSLVKQFDAA